MHERAKVDGTIGTFKSDLLHYPYKGSISGQIETINNFSGLIVQDMFEKGERYHVAFIILRPIFKFLEVYFLKLGFLDGLAGFIIANSSAYAIFVRYVKLREIENRPGSKSSL